MIILSILIPSLHRRTGMLKSLLNNLQSQIIACNASGKVEILVELDDGLINTGNKRNVLVNRAQGKYVVAIDDDDSVSLEYISSILEAAEQDCDAIVFAGTISVDGQNTKRWYISKDLPYVAAIKRNGQVWDKNTGQIITIPDWVQIAENEEVYLRYINHLVPVKREIALQVPFPNKTREEDFDYATELHKRALIKTEARIDKQLYHYAFMNIKP